MPDRTKLRKITLIPIAAKVIKETEDAGIIESFFSVLGNIDHDRDRIMPGAFTKSISEQGLGSIRVLDSHNFSSATDALGSPLKIEEVGRDALPQEVRDRFPDATGGMRVETRFNLKTQKGHDTFQLLKAGDLKEWSFGFAIVKSDFETVKAISDRRGWTLDDEGEEIRLQNLRELELFEYSPVIWGANSATSTGEAKDKSDETAQRKAEAALEKKVNRKYKDKKPTNKSTNLREQIRTISIAFYNQFPDTNDGHVYWVLEVWDEFLVVLDEHVGGDKHWKVSYHLDQDEAPVFAHQGEWGEVEQVWVDKLHEGEAQKEKATEEPKQEEAVKKSLPKLLDEANDFAKDELGELARAYQKQMAGQMTEMLLGLDQTIGAALQQSLMAVATMQLEEWIKDGRITPDQFVVLSSSIGKTLGTMAISIPSSVKEIAVPASIVTATKNGPVIVARKVLSAKLEDVEPEDEEEQTKKPSGAEPPEKALTPKGDEALEILRAMKRQNE